MSNREAEPRAAEYFCLPMFLACVVLGGSLIAGLWWLV